MADPVQRDGTWWQEATGGAWLKWDSEEKKWKGAEGPPPPPPGRSPVRVVTELAFEHWATLFAIAGLTIYAVVRVGHDQFYGRLGVTAEEVGLNHTLILGRAALYLFLSATGIVALIVLAGIVARVLDTLAFLAGGSSDEPPAKRGAKEAGHGRGLSTVAGAVASATVSLILNGEVLRRLVPDYLTTPDGALLERPDFIISRGFLFIASLLAALSTGFALAHWLITSARRREKDSPVPRLFGMARAWTIALAAACLIFVAFIATGRYGYVTGDHVAAGETVGAGALGLLSVRADPVCTALLERPAPGIRGSDAGPDLEGPFTYLGQADGFLILYEPHKQDGLLRVPAGKVALRLDSVVRSC